MPISTSSPTHPDVFSYNSEAWDRQAAQACEWSLPVSSEVVAAARAGRWSVRLTPGEMPASWLGDVRNLRILCLASGGGQQAPVLAAAGAAVTVLDASEKQLEQDRMVAQRDGLTLATIQGDMRDLSAFADESFDLIFNPISNLYVPDVKPVWRECARVLKRGGKLLASFYNPVVFVGDRHPEYAEQGMIRPCYKIPYSDLDDMPEAALQQKLARGEALVFGHSLADQIGAQLDAGLLMSGYYEDFQPNPRFVIDRFLPTFIATCAIKP
ncbi:class I SAM-dependent methyltransferase [Paraherbaspirillum soli]|uniref:Class I SAM-dependent methyltransferase n=1 Tax=Paraherbaspirillum soli TaxID=631222 RepID=A0ABW0M687_9BURK